MQFQKAIDTIKCIFGIPKLEPDSSGICRIFVDDFTVSFYSRLSHFVMIADMGTPLQPDNNFEPTLKSALSHNYASTLFSNEILSLNPTTNRLCITKQLKENTFSVDSLQHELDTFINSLETWNELLNNPNTSGGFPLSGSFNFSAFK